MSTNLNLTDMETCYKAFRREVLEAIEIEENRFGFEPEITAKLAQQNLRIYEVGISYAGRTYAEGKKIRRISSTNGILNDYFSSFSDSWLAHCRAYAADMIASLGLHEGSLVVEVASNDGYLLQYLKEAGVACWASSARASCMEPGVPAWTLCA